MVEGRGVWIDADWRRGGVKLMGILLRTWNEGLICGLERRARFFFWREGREKVSVRSTRRDLPLLIARSLHILFQLAV